MQAGMVDRESLYDWTNLDQFEVLSPGRKGVIQPIARIGMTLRAYVFDSHTTSVRKRLLAAAEHYRSLAGAHLRHRAIDGQRWTRYSDTFDLPGSAKPVLDNPRAKYAVYMTSGEADSKYDENRPQKYGCSVGFSTYMSDLRSPGYLSCHFPFMWMAEPSNSFIEFARRVCELMSPIYMSAGMGFVLPNNSGVFLNDLVPHSFSLVPVAQRLIGVELSERGFRYSVNEGYYSVNWLTAVGDEWLDRIGGQQAVSARLVAEPGFDFWPYPGGLSIRAGQHPQLGDAENAHGVPEYSTLDHVLSPLRIRQYRTSLLAPPPHGRLAPAGDPLYAQTCENYLRRFELVGVS
jgi:hypothetical protein